jgi:hypothetical protein
MSGISLLSYLLHSGQKKWSQKDSIFFYRIVHINFSSTALAFFGEINKKIPGCFLDIF